MAVAIIDKYLSNNTANQNLMYVSPGVTLLILKSGYLAALGENSRALDLGGGNTVGIAGTVRSTSSSAIFADERSGFNTINLSATASISGAYGINLLGDSNKISNAGSIVGTLVGIRLEGDLNTLTNTGSIRGQSAVWVGYTDVINSGVIRGSDAPGHAAIRTSGDVINSGSIVGATAIGISGFSHREVTNTGLIQGTNANHVALFTGSGADTIINNGTIRAPVSAVSLGAGSDTYDGRGGQVFGKVAGGSGNDTLLGGAFADSLEGGPGQDVLNGGGGNDIYYLYGEPTGSDTLDDTSGADAVYSNVTRSLAPWAFMENLVMHGGAPINGTGNAANNGIIGNSAANVLAGLGGVDTLFGGGGNDFLFGQGDRDMLKGEAGDDQFVYQVAADSLAGPTCDIIMDFDDVGNDRVNLSALFGPALVYKGVAVFNGIGQVRINDIAGPDLIVEVNLSGNATPEMQIYLQATALAMIGIDDFLL